MDWLIGIAPYYIFGAIGMYYMLFKDMDSRWKYVLPFLWIAIVPLAGIMALIVESDRI